MTLPNACVQVSEHNRHIGVEVRPGGCWGVLVVVNYVAWIFGPRRRNRVCKNEDGHHAKQAGELGRASHGSPFAKNTESAIKTVSGTRVLLARDLCSVVRLNE